MIHKQIQKKVTMGADTIKELRSWLTPALVVLSSFLIKGKLSDIEEKMRLIDDVNGRVIRNEVRISAIESRQNQQDGQFQTMLRLIGVDNAQKNWDEILKNK